MAPRVNRDDRDKPLVLLVEDDFASHGALRALLERSGCEVLSAMTVAGGLALLLMEPDYAILDLWLPDGDGGEILGRIRGRGLAVAVAVVTGSADSEQVRRARGLKPEVFLQKPIDFNELCRGLGIAR